MLTENPCVPGSIPGFATIPCSIGVLADFKQNFRTSYNESYNKLTHISVCIMLCFYIMNLLF